MKLAQELNIIDMKLTEADTTKFKLDIDRKRKLKYKKHDLEKINKEYNTMMAYTSSKAKL